MVHTAKSNSKICIVGASGFIGKRLVADLVQEGGHEIKVLSRNKHRDLSDAKFGNAVDIFEGDLSYPETLSGFIEQGSTVINLAYLRNAGEDSNLACTQNLLAACNEAGVARLIHCSTADVAGRVVNDLCDEQTQCLPVTEYAMTKLKIEQTIAAFPRKQFDAVILRPTAVLGIGGESLKKLAADIVEGSLFKNYLKSCLFGRRRMNLVPVENVTAALIFLNKYTGHFDGSIYIVSNDDDSKNNFIDVERFLIDMFEVKKYYFPRIVMPSIVLKIILTILGRNNVNPRCDFASSKLHQLGFESPVKLSDGLAEFATWYRSTYLVNRGPRSS